MQREIYQKLLDWKRNTSHHPLLLTGAPMVGKTYVVKEFGKNEYVKVARFSFLDQPILKNIFRNQPEVSKVLRMLSTLFRRDIVPGETLLILDDIQYCPDALEMLSDFSEAAPSLDLIACGSFCEGDGAYEKIPFAQLAHLSLHPMNFTEFLLAMEQNYLVELLHKRQWDSIRALSSTFEDYLRQYCFCGGMPAVVQAYSQNRETGPFAIRQMQSQILQAIETNLSKKQQEVWDAVHARMTEPNHKFMFADIKKAARQKDYMPAVRQLIQKGLLFRTNKVSTVSQPLDYYMDEDSFVLNPLDSGLLGAKLGVEPEQMLLGGALAGAYNDAFPRQLISQKLRSMDFPVYHYARTGSLVCIDYIIQTASRIVAVEVNARPNGNSKALKTFMAANPGRQGIRASLEAHTKSALMETIPLYAMDSFLDSL